MGTVYVCWFYLMASIVLGLIAYSILILFDLLFFFLYSYFNLSIYLHLFQSCAVAVTPEFTLLGINKVLSYTKCGGHE